MRLDRFISSHTAFSRADVKLYMRQGRVKVNDVKTKSISLQVNPETDTVMLDEDVIEEIPLQYIMLHKPVDYVSANVDANYPTVIDILSNRDAFIGTDKQWNHIQLSEMQVAGRLDVDTTGLILLTNDGQWNHRVTSPRKSCTKTYRVELDSPLTEDLPQRFLDGLELHNEKHPTLPATLEIISDYKAKLSIQEGKYHQVKRMFAAVGNHVVSLHRERIAGITLDEQLPLNQYRLLTEAEITSVG